MRPRTSAIVAGALVYTLAAAASAQSSKDWEKITNPDELRALHSNKTIKGNMGAGTSYTAYYRSDGKALLLWKNQRIPRTWMIKGNDQVCYSDSEFGTRCYSFQRHKEKRDDIIIERVSDNAIIFPKIEDGIPKF